MECLFFIAVDSAACYNLNYVKQNADFIEETFQYLISHMKEARLDEFLRTILARDSEELEHKFVGIAID